MEGACACWLRGMVPLIVVLGAPRRERDEAGQGTDRVLAPLSIELDARLGVAWAM